MTADNRLVRTAFYFAEEAHGDQKRKYTGEPYIVHPLAVASLVWLGLSAVVVLLWAPREQRLRGAAVA